MSKEIVLCGNGQEITLKEGNNVLGRGPLLNIRNPKVSRQQCDIFVEGCTVTLTAMGPNSMYAHSQRTKTMLVSPHVFSLRDGDKIEFPEGTFFSISIPGQISTIQDKEASIKRNISSEPEVLSKKIRLEDVETSSNIEEVKPLSETFQILVGIKALTVDHFKVTYLQPLESLMNLYCFRQKVLPPKYDIFLYKGKKITNLDTPQSLGMESMAVIDCLGILKLKRLSPAKPGMEVPCFKYADFFPFSKLKREPPIVIPMQFRINIHEHLHQSLPENLKCVQRELEVQQSVSGLLQGLTLDDENPPGLDGPDTLTITLLPHQRCYMHWALQREKDEQCPGGILADDQGLGKTVQTIANVMQHKKIETGTEKDGPTLIIAPLSLVSQWHDEILNKCKKGTVSSYMYVGPRRARLGSELRDYDFVITTYATAAGDRQKESKDGRILKRPGPVMQITWRRVVLDEGHTIKNPRSGIAQGCSLIKASAKWVLSGTPIQNSFEDLYSLIKFLNFEPYTSREEFMTQFIPYDGATPEHANKCYKRLQTVLKNIMLRRTKQSKLGGKNILNLPPREVCIQEDMFTVEEQNVYNQIQTESKSSVDNSSYVNVLSALLRLRQFCSHPALIKNKKKPALVTKEMKEKVSSFPKQTSEIFEKVTQHGTDEMLCEVCKDIPEFPNLTRCGHIFCDQCAEKILSTVEEEESFICVGCKQKVSRSDILLNVPTPTVDVQNNEIEYRKPSTKVNAVLKIIKSEPERKTIIFSQWTTMLDILSVHLEDNNIKYVRLDGSMQLSNREKSIHSFKNNKDVIVFLISLKCGSLGLNLIVASRVILTDIWWNPFVEEQAIDRAHRIGQKRCVNVYRLTISKTVEEGILALQEKKREMAKAAFGEGSVNVGKLSMQELLHLFQT